MRELVLGALSMALLMMVMPGCEPTGDDDDAEGDDDAADDDAADDDAVDDDDAADDDAADDDASSDVIVHLVASLTTEAQYFSYVTDNGVMVEYFGVMGSDGDPHIAFDACDSCYAAGLGYSQAGENMVCNNCGNSYPINSIGTENTQGGCWPGYLENEIVGDEIRIQPATMEAGEWRFP